MNREKFLKELDFLLQDILDEERSEALLYYQNYFDEAGSENEEQIINELQSPERVAALIKAGLNSSFENSIEYSENSMGNSNYNRSYEVIERENKIISNTKNDAKNKYNGNPERNRILMITLIGLAIVCLSPLIGGAFGVLVGIVGVAFSIIVVLASFSFASIISAIFFIIQGASVIVKFPGAGLISIGGGVILIGLALVFLKLIKKCLSLAPKIFRWITDVCRKIIDKVGEII